MRARFSRNGAPYGDERSNNALRFANTVVHAPELESGAF